MPIQAFDLKSSIFKRLARKSSVSQISPCPDIAFGTPIETSQRIRTTKIETLHSNKEEIHKNTRQAVNLRQFATSDDDSKAKKLSRSKHMYALIFGKACLCFTFLTQDLLEEMTLIWSLIHTIYVIFAVPFRVGYLFDPYNEVASSQNWNIALCVFSLADFIGFMVRGMTYRSQLHYFAQYHLRKMFYIRILPHRHNRVDSSCKNTTKGLTTHAQLPGKIRIIQNVATSASSERHLSVSILACIMIDVIPWELVLLFFNYNMTHVAGLLRYFQAIYCLPKRWSLLISKFRSRNKLWQLLSSSSKGLLVYLIVLGIYLAHLAGSGYMLIAHVECGLKFVMCSKNPVPGCWVLRDSLEKGTLWRKYFRSLYWGCKTVTTLGQGDLIPTTIAETAYRIFVQFAAGLWATAVLTACAFHFSYVDVNMATNLTTRLMQMSKFTSTRKISPFLVMELLSYFHYMRRTRHGVEEQLILANLPEQYRTRCANFVKYKHVEKISIFHNRNGAFLRSILERLIYDCFVPNQYLLQLHEPEDMLILSSGEIRILNEKREDCGRLVAGNTYAERALLQDFVSSHFLVADTFCEAWFLQRDAFDRAIYEHFPSKSIGSSCMEHPYTPYADSTTRLNTNSKNNNSTNLRRASLVPTSQVLRSKLFSDQMDAGIDRSHWRHMNSKFQRRWRFAECTLMCFTLMEVPCHIAFNRAFGLLGSMHLGLSYGGSLEVAEFYAYLLVEIFFLIDMYFRAFCFIRMKNTEAHSDRNILVYSINSYSQSSSTFGLLSDRKKIFEHYLENEDIIFDILANFPLSIIWDIIDKNGIPNEVINAVRFLRVLQILRARHLRRKLKRLMLEHGISPAMQLLIKATVACCILAILASCLFYMASDGFSSHKTVQAEYISPSKCLEDASVYGNCTWYIYDYDTFKVQSPLTRSVYWSIVLLSTVGFGDIVSFSTLETVVGSIWIFFGAVICYVMGSIISSALAQVTILGAIRQDRVEVLNLALQAMPQLLSSTKTTIRQYYATEWELNGSAILEDEMIRHFPMSLRKSVCSSLYVEDLKQSLLFKWPSTSKFADSEGLVLNELARAAKTKIYLPNVFIMRANHAATVLSVVQSGEVELLANLRTESEPASTQKAPHKQSANSHTQQGSSSIDPDNASAHPVYNNPTETVKRSTYLSGIRQSFEVNHARISLISTSPRRQHRVAVPIVFLKRGDFFGEESVSSQRHVYQFSARAVSGVQILVIQRRSFLALVQKYPRVFAEVYLAINAYVAKEKETLKQVERNLSLYPKISRHCGMRHSILQCDHLRKRYMYSARSADFLWRTLLSLNKILPYSMQRYNENSKKIRGSQIVFDPANPYVVLWHRIIALIIVYNFYQIVFRIAFLPRPSHYAMVKLTMIDYLCDVCLYVDIYLKFGRVGFTEHGETNLDPLAIRARYRKSWLGLDCWSMLPIFYVGKNYLLMTVARLPRLIRSLHLVYIVENIQTRVQEELLHGSTMASSIFDLLKFFIIFLSTAHYVGSIYYMLGRFQIDHNLVERSWVSMDFILIQHPNSISVHYLRTMYWCLTTFTVDCFGDIVARNSLETVYCIFTCILGWIFIGQVIARISTLIITLDKAAKEQHERSESFTQYAIRRKLPSVLRQHAMASLAYKSEHSLQLKLHKVFDSLPSSLHVQFFEELYGSYIRALPEFDGLSNAQVEAVASILKLEIYLPGDIIADVTCFKQQIYIMKDGCAEIYSARTRLVFGSITSGDVYGVFGFFVPHIIRLASLRAVHSSQVLILKKKDWKRLWPTDCRISIEQKIIPKVMKNYRAVALSFVNILKNFSIRAEGSVISVLDDWFFDGGTSINLSNLSMLQFCGSDVTKSHLKVLGQQNYQHIQSQRTVDTKYSITGIRKQSSIRNWLHPSAMNAISNKLLTSISGIYDSKQNEEPTQGSSLAVSTTAQFQEMEALPQIYTDKHSACTNGAAEILGFFGSLQDMKAFEEGKAQHLSPAVPTENKSATISARKATISCGSSVVGEKLYQSLGRRKLVQKSVAQFKAQSLLRYKFEFSSENTVRWRRHIKRIWTLRYIDSIWIYILKALAKDVKKARAYESISGTGACHSKLSVRRRHSFVCMQQARMKSVLSIEQIEVFESRLAKQVQFKWPNDNQDVLKRQTPSILSQLHSISSSRALSVSNSRVRPRAQNNSQTVPKQVNKSFLGSSKDSGLNPFQIWQTPPARSIVLYANAANSRHIWDLFTLLCDYYCIFIIPFRISFFQDEVDRKDYRSAMIAWYAAEFAVVDTFCALNFILRRHYFTILRDGEQISDPEDIAMHYYTHGSYIRDLFCAMPFEFVPALVYVITKKCHRPPKWLQNHFWSCVFFLRCSKLSRCKELHELNERMKHYVLYDLKFSKLTPTIFYFIQLMLDFAIGTHWIACLFYGASYWSYSNHMDTPSWLTTAGMLSFRSNKSLSQVPITTKYLRSLHFSIGAITTVCYGDIIPMNPFETGLTLIVIFLSIGIFSMLSGVLFKIFEMEFGRRARFEQRVTQAGHYMMFHEFPDQIWAQLQRYFTYLWNERKGMNEEEMLCGLTNSVKKQIAVYVHGNLIQNLWLFETCNTSFAESLIAAMRNEIYVPNDVIIQHGDTGRSLYIIESGLVSIRVVRVRSVLVDSQAAETAMIVNDAVNASPIISPVLAARKQSESIAGANVEDPVRTSFNFYSLAKVWKDQGKRSKVIDVGPTTNELQPRALAQGPALSLIASAKAPNNLGSKEVHRSRSSEQTKRIQMETTEAHHVIGSFEYFGERSLIFGTPRTATCIALKVCSVFCLTHANYERILADYPDYRRKNMQDWIFNARAPKYTKSKRAAL